MLKKGKWIAENECNGKAGFHLNELYSPWRSWKEIVEDYLEAKDNPEQLKTWVNTSLGESWEQKGDAPEYKRLYDNRESYTIGKVPDGGILLTAGVDVQKDRLELEVVAWGKNKESWSIDYRVISGDTATSKPWDLLTRVLNEQFTHANGGLLPIKMMAVDSGYNTQHVYNWVRKQASNRVMAIKGQDELHTMASTPNFVDITIQGSKIKRGAKVWPLGVNIIKSELYGYLKLEKPVDGEKYPSGYHHFPQYNDDYFKMLTAEHLVLKKVRGYTHYLWEKFRDRNEALDCRVYARAAAFVVGIDRMTDDQLEDMKKQYTFKSNPTKPARRERYETSDYFKLGGATRLLQEWDRKGWYQYR